MHRAKTLSQNNTSTEGAQAHHKHIQKNTTHQQKACMRTTRQTEDANTNQNIRWICTNMPTQKHKARMRTTRQIRGGQSHHQTSRRPLWLVGLITLARRPLVICAGRRQHPSIHQHLEIDLFQTVSNSSTGWGGRSKSFRL